MSDDLAQLYREFENAKDKARAMGDQYVWSGDVENKPVGSTGKTFDLRDAEELMELWADADRRLKAYRAALGTEIKALVSR